MLLMNLMVAAKAVLVDDLPSRVARRLNDLQTGAYLDRDTFLVKKHTPGDQQHAQEDGHGGRLRGDSTAERQSFVSWESDVHWPLARPLPAGMRGWSGL